MISCAWNYATKPSRNLVAMSVSIWVGMIMMRPLSLYRRHDSARTVAGSIHLVWEADMPGRRSDGCALEWDWLLIGPTGGSMRLQSCKRTVRPLWWSDSAMGRPRRNIDRLRWGGRSRARLRPWSVRRTRPASRGVLSIGKRCYRRLIAVAESRTLLRLSRWGWRWTWIMNLY